MNRAIKIVCLGGGIGTSNLIRGLKQYTEQITVITSMADDGGSSGRLRKAYHIMPPGDIVSCIAALIPDEQKELAALLKHRFPGHERDMKTLGGHKLGNLIMLAEMQRTGDFYQAIDMMKKVFGVTATILPASDERTHLSARTKDGRRIHGETTLDLALYSQPHGIEKIFIRPKMPRVNTQVIEALRNSDVIISGPGDLYTNQLPVLIIPQIKEALIASAAKKIFILNIANKPFETKGYTLQHFVQAITEHLGCFPFQTIIANNNQSLHIPQKYHYDYIQLNPELSKTPQPFTLIQADVVNQAFPLYHDSEKLASILVSKV